MMSRLTMPSFRPVTVPWSKDIYCTSFGARQTKRHRDTMERSDSQTQKLRVIPVREFENNGRPTRDEANRSELLQLSCDL